MSLDIRGGPGSLAVALDDLAAAAARLLDWAREVERVALVVARVATDPLLVATVPLSPRTAATAEARLALLCGPTGLPGAAVLTRVLAAEVRSAVAAYAAAEDAVRVAVERAQDAVMLTIGIAAPAVGVAALGLELAGAEPGRLLDEGLFRWPAAADLAGGAEGLVAGLALDPFTAPLLAAAGCGPATLPQTYEAGLGCLTVAAGGAALLSDGTGVAVVQEPGPRGGSAPADLGDLLADEAALSDAEHYPARVRVVEVPQADGSSAWVVEVPGTQEWGPRSDGNPFDLTTDVRQMAGQATVAALGVERALAAARFESGRRTGRDTSAEPVLLTGHSLGGIVAAALAADPRFRSSYPVTHVVTAGAPVARIAVPSSVSVLSIEHRQDVVPRLEGEPNPSRSGWLTVTRDVGSDPAARGRASGAHSASLYAATAREVDASRAPSVAAWRDSSARFFHAAPGTEPVVRDYRVERLGRAPPAQ